MSDDLPIQDLNMSINSLVSLLKKNKQVIIQKIKRNSKVYSDKYK